jgi:DNA-binding transcriptional ArsR family regulator
MSEELVSFFKALADANRLKIVGLLSQQPYSVEQLAAMLHLRPSTISHHLAKLS